MQPNAVELRGSGARLTLELGCGVSVTRTESPPPAAASRSSTAAEGTGSRDRLWVWDREADREREEEGDQEAVRGEDKQLGWWVVAVDTAATAAVASSMASEWSGAAAVVWRDKEEGIRI